MRIQVSSGAYTSRIDHKLPSSDLMDIQISLISAYDVEEVIDNAMVNLLKSEIAAERSNLAFRIENELLKGIDESNLLKLVDEAIANVEKRFVPDAKSVMDQKTKVLTKPIAAFSKALNIQLKPYDIKLDNNAYQKTGSSFKTISSIFLNNT